MINPMLQCNKKMTKAIFRDFVRLTVTLSFSQHTKIFPCLFQLYVSSTKRPMDVDMFILPFSSGGSDSLISFVGPIFASMKVLVDLLFELSAYWELD